MRATVSWQDAPPDRDGVRSVCYDVAYKPDGSQLVTGMGNRVLVYGCQDGALLHSLKAHKDAVYAVSWSFDGTRFASGGADKTIIIWTSEAEGILKYNHNESVQCLAFNPCSMQLASATASDFGLWAPEQKSVQKHKVSGKVLCMGWTKDGQHLALGQYDGCVSVRDRAGGEKVKIQRSAPIWSLAWNPNKREKHDVVAVGCWDGTLSFYQLNGMQVGDDRVLGFDPCSVSYFGGRDGQDHSALLEGGDGADDGVRAGFVGVVRAGASRAQRYRGRFRGRVHQHAPAHLQYRARHVPGALRVQGHDDGRHRAAPGDGAEG
jgi:intraflagellar transport protein 122